MSPSHAATKLEKLNVGPPISIKTHNAKKETIDAFRRTIMHADPCVTRLDIDLFAFRYR